MHYIIGDVHANVHELKKLLVLLQPSSADTVIFLGDYINKNPYTRETIDLLMGLQRDATCVFIKGNHEFVWERYITYGETHRNFFLLDYGGIDALKGFTDKPEELLLHNKMASIKKFLHDYIELIKQMHDYYLVDEYIALHAGLISEQLHQDPIQFDERNYFLREADIDFNKKYMDTYITVAGHTHFGVEPLIKPAYINLDLGAGYGYYVGALIVEDKYILRSDGKKFTLN